MWAFNSAKWSMTPEEYELGLSLVGIEEKDRISRFYFEKDKKLALAGRLMIQRLINEVFLLPYKRIPFLLSRTKEKKPCLLFEMLSLEAQNLFPFFNFNLSHHGDWVVLVSDPEYLIGADVMKIEITGRDKDQIQPFFHNMRNCFTKFEWLQIYEGPAYHYADWPKERIESRKENFASKPSATKQNLDYFMRFWTLKESYIKGVGIGLGMELQDFFFRQLRVGPLPKKRADFDFDPTRTDAEVCVKGVWLPQWTFKQISLDEEHMIAIAYGPPADSLQSFLDTFPKKSGSGCVFGDEEKLAENIAFSALSPDADTAVDILTIQDLLPNM